jgi:hypothetical protein
MSSRNLVSHVAGGKLLILTPALLNHKLPNKDKEKKDIAALFI